MSDLFDAEVNTTGPVMILILPEGCPLLMATEFLGWAAAAAAPDGAPRKAVPFTVAAPLLARCRLAVSGASSLLRLPLKCPSKQKLVAVSSKVPSRSL